jgi:hypothetical protein
MSKENGQTDQNPALTKEEIFKAGEKELKQAFEEVQNRNIETVIAFTQATREIMRDQQDRMGQLERNMAELIRQMGQLNTQMNLVQARLYQAGIKGLEPGE